MTPDETDPTGETGPERPASGRPTDAEIRAIAQQLVLEAHASPPASPSAALSASGHELAPADEDRVEEAVVALGAADPEDTTRAEREAEGNTEQRGEPDGDRTRTR